MKWILRVLLWMLLLALPCWLVSARYQRVLCVISESLLQWTGRRVSLFGLQVYAPMDLGLYTAMCLASVRSRVTLRRRALLLGLPLLAGVQIAVIVLSAVPVVFLAGHGLAARGTARLMVYAIQTIVWISAPSAWLLFLGSSELPHTEPAAASVERRKGGRKSGSSKWPDRETAVREVRGAIRSKSSPSRSKAFCPVVPCRSPEARK
jgi:hypothetical protein